MDNDAVKLGDWKFPLSNVSECGGRGHRARPTARVSDAAGRVLMIFAGQPYRKNSDAIAMATEFCEVMNRRHNERRNCDVGTPERHEMNKIMCMDDFDMEFHVRLTDKCCANCKHGECEYEDGATCRHPNRNDGGKSYEAGEETSRVFSYNTLKQNVCDLWERKGGADEGLLEIVQKALSAPPRNCDHMGVDDAFSAFSFMCDNTNCSDCPYKRHNRFGDREFCAMLFLYDNGNGGKEGGAE